MNTRLHNPSALATTAMIAAGAFVGVGALVLAAKAYSSAQERKREAARKKKIAPKIDDPKIPDPTEQKPDDWGVRGVGDVTMHKSGSWPYLGIGSKGELRRYDTVIDGKVKSSDFYYKPSGSNNIYDISGQNEDAALKRLDDMFGHWNIVGVMVEQGFLPATTKGIQFNYIYLADSIAWRVFLNPQVQYVFTWTDGNDSSRQYLKQPFNDAATAKAEGVKYLRGNYGALA